MRRDLINGALAVLVLTVLFGLAYPLFTIGVAQLAFPGKADGSRVERDGKVVGSKLIAQDFRKQVGENEEGEPILEADPRYFQSRPSQTTYAANTTGFSNLGPNSADLADELEVNLKAFLELEGPYNLGLTRDRVPPDAVHTSGSGVDPHISEANARIQARRVADERGLPLRRVRDLVEENTDDRALGFLGEPGVNVLELNLSLDEEGR